MTTEAWVGILMGAVMGSLLLYEIAVNAPARLRRSQLRPAPAGGSPCGTCGTAGTLSVLTTSSSEESSSDLVMYCARCGSNRRI